jgi:homopolymeric O-antigen transport system permease protein
MTGDSAPVARTVIEPGRGWSASDWVELWRHRELVAFLALRDLRVRYKQTLLGAGWAVLQPLLMMSAFTVLFGALLGHDHLPTAAGVPYAISTYCALVPWQLFATALATSSNSLINNQHIVSKVYFPRLVVVLAPILAALVDFAVAFAVLIAMMLFAGLPIRESVAAIPFFVALAVAASFAASVWLAAINALYRDVRHVIPFLVQVWMFASPVVYTTASVMDGRPDWLRALYAINPLSGVIDGFRWALLGAQRPSGYQLAASALIAVAIGQLGLHFFRRVERRLADVI